jgi:hypothetical protein
MMALGGLLHLCMSGSAYAEYEEVISRPRFRSPDSLVTHRRRESFCRIARAFGPGGLKHERRQLRLTPNLGGTRLAFTSRPAKRISMTASGTWVDWFIHQGPDGDPSDSFCMKAFEPLRRMPDENWFALIGGLDSNVALSFRIGSRCTYTARAAGELTCFANDVEGFYWNNYGEVLLTVARIAWPTTCHTQPASRRFARNAHMYASPVI